MRLFFVFFIILSSNILEARTWKNTSGKSFEGAFIKKEGNQVKIKRSSDNKVFNVPVNVLSVEDQKFIEEKVSSSVDTQTDSENQDKSQDEEKTDDIEDGAIIKIKFSEWIEAKEFKSFVKKQMKDNRYPMEIEGGLFDEKEKYRAKFFPKPPGKFLLEYKIGADQKAITRNTKLLKRKDYSLKHQQSFKVSEGKEGEEEERKYQAVWIFSNNIASYKETDFGPWMNEKDFEKDIKDMEKDDMFPVVFDMRSFVKQDGEKKVPIIQTRSVFKPKPENTKIKYSYTLFNNTSKDNFDKWVEKNKKGGYELINPRSFELKEIRRIYYTGVCIKED